VDYRLAEWRSTEPSAWRVTLASGSVVDVWADSYQELDAFVIFSTLIDAERPPQDSTLIVARTPSNPLRLDVAVARFRKSDVSDITSV
jgi:hypothetical protein